MFRGRYDGIVDEKGRLSVPAKFREVLSTLSEEKLIITTFDNCLWAYPLAEWLRIEAKVAALPQFKASVKALQRVFVSGAMECPLDKQGRILVPNSLREYAGLKKDLVLVGMTKKIEIWSKDAWENVFNASLKEVSGATELADLDI